MVCFYDYNENLLQMTLYRNTKNIIRILFHVEHKISLRLMLNENYHVLIKRNNFESNLILQPVVQSRQQYIPL